MNSHSGPISFCRSCARSLPLSARDVPGELHFSSLFCVSAQAQLDFRDEARNLERFRYNFSASFWAASVSFPKPIPGLISHDVLVETFEAGESVATYLHRAGERPAGEWKQDARGQWYMVEKGAPTEQGVRYAGTANKGDLRSNIALCGVHAYLKMLIWDNYIHADLHPGNVLIRQASIGPWARLQRYLVMGDSSEVVPHIVFLDAGLAASFNSRIFSSAATFFEAVTQQDGVKIGTAILGLAESQPFVDATPGAHEGFVNEVAEKCAAQKAEFDRGEGRPGDNIRAYMDSVRKYRVVLDPTVMVTIHRHTHTHTHTHIYIYIYIYTFVYIYVYIYTYTYIYIYTHIYIYIYIYLYLYLFIYV